MNEISNKVGELVDLIKQSDDYQEYISLMNIMKEDKDINFLIKEIKDSQKKIMKLKSLGEDYSSYDELIKKDLDRLGTFPIYVEFSSLQEKLNTSFQVIKESIEILNEAEKEMQSSNTLQTKILNIEFLLGKWHGLMEVLLRLNSVDYINIAEKTEPTRKKLLKFIEKIYK